MAVTCRHRRADPADCAGGCSQVGRATAAGRLRLVGARTGNIQLVEWLVFLGWRKVDTVSSTKQDGFLVLGADGPLEQRLELGHKVYALD